MKALVYRQYGSPDVLRIEEVEKPVPGDDELLVKVAAASLNAADWHLLRAEPFPVRFMTGLRKPKHTILGSDIAGQVEAVGRNVRQLKPGDEVFGNSSNSGWGGFAEYACLGEVVAAKPAGPSFAEAAALPLAAITALQALRDVGHIERGQRVLINGAAGGVGSFAVQIAKSFGTEVTAVTSTANLELARSLGADQILDYTQQDFTASGQRYDLILGANGYHPIRDYRRALTPRGVYVMSGGSGAQMAESIFLGPWLSRTRGKRLARVTAKATLADLLAVSELVEAGKIKPVVDRTYPLSEGAAAFRYLDAGHARGKIVITLAAEAR
jgi:NADPH:quinone reductase-like Zn-dependent oxidoreductase